MLLAHYQQLDGRLPLLWAMVAMGLSVTTISFDSLGGQPSLFFQAILSVGKPVAPEPTQA